MILRIPTHVSPDKPIDLSGIKLLPGPRVNLLRFGSGGHTNSLDLEVERDGETVRDWIVFHSFITNSKQSIDFYADEKSYTINKVRPESQNPHDFNDFLPVIFWRTAQTGEKLEVKSYLSLYRQYLAFDQPKRELIKSYLMALTTTEQKPNRRMFDRTYWKIVQFYSIIESVLGQPIFCPHKLECNECGNDNLSHYRISATKFLNDELGKMIKNASLLTHYKTIISTARNEIRHATVHAAKTPIASYPASLESGTQVEYTLEESVKTHKSDLHALNALCGRLEDVTFYILANHLFGFDVFEHTRGYSVAYLNLKIEREKKSKQKGA